ncbi:hypothetical protein [Streptomyces pactum]|nr:hypothetical protein [Streptomyces pactum]
MTHRVSSASRPVRRSTRRPAGALKSDALKPNALKPDALKSDALKEEVPQ